MSSMQLALCSCKKLLWAKKFQWKVKNEMEYIQEPEQLCLDEKSCFISY